MNADFRTTAYFATEIDARRAAEDLRAQGCDVEVRPEAPGGGSGAMLEVSGGAGDPGTIDAIIMQHNGRTNDTTPSTGTVITGTIDRTGRSSSTGDNPNLD
ncbi:MAG TPA: hypothetical protein VFL13_10450 [Candidatus Baltobacteraceae bacterium]|nr:hypothetical protein [Candidatus Baltobacteraceae bacterium]